MSFLAVNSLNACSRLSACLDLKITIYRGGWVVRSFRKVKSMSYTVRDIVNRQGRKYTEHLLSAVMEAGFDLRAIPAVLLGGGASVVSRHLSPKDALCKTIFLLDDKVNAVGFERALNAVSRRKSEV